MENEVKKSVPSRREKEVGKRNLRATMSGGQRFGRGSPAMVSWGLTGQHGEADYSGLRPERQCAVGRQRVRDGGARRSSGWGGHEKRTGVVWYTVHTGK